jgi:hypothetical protein
LAARSDVLIENFKFGGLVKYGLDYKSLSAENPRLVYCSITGFGQDGPYKTRAGYDLLVQGMGGIMDITGDPNGEPTRLGVAFADVFTGVYSALAITAALKEREQTGKGSPSTWRCSIPWWACSPTRRCSISFPVRRRRAWATRTPQWYRTRPSRPPTAGC